MKGLLRALIVLVVLGTAGFLALAYFTHLPQRDRADRAADRAGDVGPPESGPVGQFTPLAQPRPAPALSFAGRDGSTLRLADFRGHWLLVNFWATWCGPCVQEMPSLDRLQARLGPRLQVLAISEDRRGAEAVDPFLAKLGLKSLVVYLDPKTEAQEAFKISGLPTSYLVDPEGRIRATLEGAAQWDAPAMMNRLEGFLGRDDGATGPIKASAEH